MVQSASLFSQLLHEVPRHEFARLVNTHQGERHAKGFTCWAQFTAMLFCQLAHTDSLREICNGLACCVGKLVHLGITRGPSKSSLSYANVHRPAAIVEDLFWSMTHRFRARSQLGARTHAFRFKNKLLSLDSTTISLCLSLFPWATFRRAKGGVKAHVLLDHDDYLPAYVLISQATMHDAKVLGLLRLNAGSIVAMDRAYNDYRQFARWTDAGVYFVTRMKDNAVYAVVDERDVPVHRNIHSDAIILLTGPQAQSNICFGASSCGTRSTSGRSCCSPITSTSGPRPSPASTRSGGRSSSSSRRSSRTYGSRASSARRRTRCASRFGQPCSPCSCSSGCTTSRQRGGRSPILPPCCASTSLPTVICATGLTTPSTHRH